MRPWPFALLLATQLLAQPGALVPALEDIRLGRYAAAQAKLAAPTSQFLPQLAYGVALTLDERFPEAVPVLQRCTALQPASAEADLWLYAAETMSGLVTEQHAFHIRRAGQPLRLEGQPKIRNQNEYAPEYASFVWQDMAVQYGIARESGDVRSPRLRNRLLEAGQRFVEVQFGRPELAPFARQRAQQLTQQNRHGEALLAVLQEGDFQNAAWQFRFSAALSNLGRWATARRQYTYALGLRPFEATGWLGRGIAAAHLGSERRARADLARAQRFDAAAAGRYRGQIEQAIARAAVPPAQAYAHLEQAARAGQPLDSLAPLALAVHLGANAQRLFYDETYADRLADLTAAAQANPRSADAALAVAQYLLQEAQFDARSESVERQRERVHFRQAFNENQELQAALAAVNRALTLNPAHARALLTKALVLDRLGRYGEAEPLLQRSLALSPGDAAGMRLKAEYLVMQRDRAFDQASGLRAHQVTGSRSYDQGDYRVTETTYRLPSAADLGRANSLDRAGAQFNQVALDTIRAAIRLSQGTPEGLVLSARYDFHNKRPDQAIATLRAAVKQFPQSSIAWEALARYLRRTGDYEGEEEAWSTALNLVQTTAGPKLRLAWRQILRTNWTAAEAALLAAQQLDPADARIPAYRAIIARQRGPADAAAYGRMAVALEEARLSLDDSAEGRQVSRPPSSLALVLALRYQLAARGVDAPAAEIYRGAVPFAAQIDRADRSIMMWPALLPDPQRESPAAPGFEKAGNIIWPANSATLAAEAHVGFARALRALGQRAEARQQYEIAAAWADAPRQVAPARAGEARDYGGGRAVGNGTEALIALARMAMEDKDLAAARDYHQRAQVNGSTPETRDDLQRVALELNAALEGKAPPTDGKRPGFRLPKPKLPSIKLPNIKLPKPAP